MNKDIKNKIAFLLTILALQVSYCLSQEKVKTNDNQSSVSVFSIQTGASSQLVWRGSKLIDSDYISYFDDKDFNRHITEIETIKDSKDWNITNCWSDNADLPFRKELGVSPDGNSVELNIQVTQPAYKNRTDVDLYYTFKIPVKTVVNMNWEAIVDRGSRPKTFRGILKSDLPEDFIGEDTRWLSFENDGKKIVIDFNPEGMQTYSDDKDPNRISSLWTVKKKGDFIECSLHPYPFFYGGTICGKVVIFEDEHSNYLDRHAYNMYNYNVDLPVNTAYCFGAPKHDGHYIQAGKSIYKDQQGFGWSDPEISLDTLRPSGAIYSSAFGNHPATFKSIVARQGLYLITARIGTGEKPAGPLSIVCSEKKIVSDFWVPALTAETITWPQWLENGEVEFRFDGNWRISTLALQMLQHSHEDYKFRRSVWRVSGIFEPSVLDRSSYYQKSPLMKTSISSTPLPMEVIDDIGKAVLLPEGKTALPDHLTPETAWRFNANIGTLGPNNSGDFDEFNTTELLDRRFRELKDKNINMIVLNGFLSRHTYPNHQERLDKMIPLIVKMAHSYGIKVIDHIDLTLLWNMGSGFRVLTEHTDWLQRTVTDNVPGDFFCPVNPEFKKQFFDWMIQHIKTTNIDGYMIDEQSFGAQSYCGCSHCREQFHNATGLTLPMDETSPILNNRQSKLWQSWLEWRIKVLGDWVVELKELTNEINPNLVFMRYTTHYGFTSDYAATWFGASITESARACDMLGTEIMSRNVYASYRSVFSYRKLKNSLREAYGSPIFGLIYPLESQEVAYFGWCIVNMNNQSIWQLSDLPKSSTTPNFSAFKENMNRQLAKPNAPVAMLFSTQSRDWSQDMSYNDEPLGLGESMSDAHFQYTTLIEPSLKLDKLKQYKTVLIPDAICLSDDQINILIQYAEQGGKLVLTARAGMRDAIGNKRTVWPFAEILGVANPLPEKFIKGNKLVLNDGRELIDNTLSGIEISLNGTKEVTEFLTLQTNENTVYPAGIEVPYGHGTIYYISSRIGSLNVEDETTVKREWKFEFNQETFTFQEAIFNRLLDSGSTFKPVHIPRKVLTTVYNQNEAGKTHTLVHLLNATGSNLKKGEIVYSGVPDQPFPELLEDIVFRIKLSLLKDAYITSPDFWGREKVKTRDLGNGWYEITVPKRLLKCYDIVWLEN